MTRARSALFVGALLIALIVFMPLSLALAMFGTTSHGLSARSATGTIWSGQLSEAHIGRLTLGELAVGLQPLPLFIGRARIAMAGPFGNGAMTSTAGGFAIDDTSAKLATARLFAPIPLDGLDLTDVSVAFAQGRCRKADGRIRATFAGDVGGLALAQGLGGVVRCDRGALLLPLISQSAMERLNLRIQANGSYRAEFFVKSSDPAMATTLSAAGFAPAPDGHVLRLAGKL